MMLKSVGAVMITAAFLLCAGGGAAAQQVDISQLRGLDVPEGLQQFLGAMVTKMQGLEEENVKLQEDLRWLKKDREVFQNKTRVVEAELRRELEDERKDKAALWIGVMELQNHTKKNLRHINTRLDQCEANTFTQVVERRQMQGQTPACGREAVDSMLAVCCAAPAGNGHRLEFVGCDSLPSTCSLQCSYQFISIFDNCHDDALMRGLSAKQLADWTSFYAACSEVEQSAAEMGALQPVNVRMFRIMISSDAAQSQAEMFGGQGQTEPIIGPLPQLPPPPPASSDSGSTEVQDYHAQCATENILTCVPTCNATTHGYELLANIDGTDTKFSCNLANMLFSWVGAAALGGFLGQNVAAFVSAVISGAAGTYVLTLMEDAHVGTDLVVQPGQNVIITGDAGLVAAPRWGTNTFEIIDGGSLSLTRLQVWHVHIMSGGEGHFESCVFNGGNDGYTCDADGCSPHVVTWSGNGGALNVDAGATATVQSCFFSHYHSTGQGGAIYVQGNRQHLHGFVAISDSHFISNTANGEGCTMKVDAGSILTVSTSQVVMGALQDCGHAALKVDPGATINVANTVFSDEMQSYHNNHYHAVAWSNHQPEMYSSEEATASEPLAGCVQHGTFCGSK
eukprot:SAG22_NODE_1024_length_5987_cov_3.799932_4_plen_623_part_00